MGSKFRLAFFAVMVFAVAFIAASLPVPRALALVTNVSYSSDTVQPGNSVTITVQAQEVVGAGPLIVRVGDGTDGTLFFNSCTIANVAASCTVSASGSQVTITAANNGSGSTTEAMTVQLSWQAPNEEAVYAVATCQDGGTPCTSFVAQDPIEVRSANFLIVQFAIPNLVPCDGGTVLLTVRARQQDGTIVPNVRFVFSTTAGRLTQLSGNTAELELLRGMNGATVSASTVDQDGVQTGSINVQQFCEPTSAVTITPSINLVPCEGGVVTMKAVARTKNGEIMKGLKFTFTTSAGVIEKYTDNDARLTLLKGMNGAIVTASSVDETGAIVSGTVTIQQYCEPFVSVVVTADPNVVGCDGKSTITASGRDARGHVVKGLGYHFSTDSGDLVVGPPQTAEAEQAKAQLTIRPGMASATVLVSVGNTIGTIEGQVTVQQYCPTSATTSGALTMTASKTTLGCSDKAFLAVKVKDVTGNVAPDGTTINFISNGGTINPSSAATEGGVLNVVFEGTTINPAPEEGESDVVSLASGVYRVTAAGGAQFGTIDFTVNCGSGIAPPAAVAGASGTGAAGAFRITPPNTGEAGLK